MTHLHLKHCLSEMMRKLFLSFGKKQQKQPILVLSALPMMFIGFSPDCGALLAFQDPTSHPRPCTHSWLSRWILEASHSDAQAHRTVAPRCFLPHPLCDVLTLLTHNPTSLGCNVLEYGRRASSIKDSSDTVLEYSVRTTCSFLSNYLTFPSLLSLTVGFATCSKKTKA